MKRTAIYARVSSDKQAQEGDSIPAQLDALRKWVKDKHYILVGEYVDDGVSGQKIQRDELQRLLDDVKSDRIDLILFVKLDRWFRSIRHYVATQETLDKHGVQWIAIWEPIYDTTTPQGRLIVNQMMSIAQFEAENTGSRIRQVFQYKIQQGEAITGRMPLGYKVENKHVVPDENAPIALDIFKHYDFTGNLHEVSRYALEKYGILKTFNTWRGMLKNKLYTGRYHGLENYCPAIIPDELFDSVQRRLEHNIKNDARRDTYIFSGLVYCHICGAVMSGAHAGYTKDGKRYKYRAYRCTALSRYAKKHKTVTRYESTIERYLVEHVAELAEKEKLVRTQKKPADNRKAISGLKQKVNRLKDLYVNGLIDLDEYKADKERYLAEITALEAQKRPKTSAIDKVSRIDFKCLYGTLTDEEKAYLWHSIIKRIDWDDDGIKPVFLD